MNKSDQQILDEGRKAKIILEDEDIQSALSEIQAACFIDFRSAKMTDTEALQRSHAACAGVEMLQAALRARVDRAQLVEKRKK
jgi:hypothetical protein